MPIWFSNGYLKNEKFKWARGKKTEKSRIKHLDCWTFAEIGGLADLNNDKATMKLQDFDLVLGPFNLTLIFWVMLQ